MAASNDVLIWDLSDDSISYSSDSDSESDYSDKEPVAMSTLPSMETPDDDDEVVIYVREGIPTGKKNPDGTDQLYYPPLMGMEGQKMLNTLREANVKTPTLMAIPLGLDCREITREQFRLALRVYEQNQMASMNNLEYLSKLEDWFIRVIEPKPIMHYTRPCAAEIREYNEEVDTWLNRECLKEKGFSPYCDHGLRGRLKISAETRNYIKTYVAELRRLKLVGHFSWKTSRRKK